MKTTVLLTGCAGALGLAVAEKYLAAGNRVLGTVRRQDDMQAVRDVLGNPAALSLYCLDLGRVGHSQDQLDIVLAQHPNINVLINNAGTHYPATVEDADIDRCRQLFNVNFWSPILLAQAVLPHMRQARRGHIITVGSLSALAGLPCDGIYGASKAALRAAFESLRHEVSQFNINVSMIVSGSFQSGLQRKMTAADQRTGSAYSSLYQLWLNALGGSSDSGLSANTIAEKIFNLSNSATPDFYCPVGRVAEEVLATLEKLNDVERQRAIAEWAGRPVES